MHVLVIGPHPDDEAIGCGGALCRHALNGHRVTAIFLTSGEMGLKHLPREQAWMIREEEAQRSGAVLGLTNIEFLRGPDWTLSGAADEVVPRLVRSLQQDPPELVYMPHPADAHPDHRAAAAFLQTALPLASIPMPELRGYEVWTPIQEFDYVEDISAVIDRKLRALSAHASQLNYFDYLRAVSGLNSYRGELAGRCRYAEVFQRIEL